MLAANQPDPDDNFMSHDTNTFLNLKRWLKSRLPAERRTALLKSLVDGLNHEEFIKPGYVPSYYDQNITGLHFYHNLVFIQKGRNAEGSNLVRNNQMRP
ncbi:MAG TPA: hypothetical protein VIK62_06335 [Verrucomicrobiae bacterium]